jgi:hypothetical protein
MIGLLLMLFAVINGNSSATHSIEKQHSAVVEVAASHPVAVTVTPDVLPPFQPSWISSDKSESPDISSMAFAVLVDSEASQTAGHVWSQIGLRIKPYRMNESGSFLNTSLNGREVPAIA